MFTIGKKLSKQAAKVYLKHSWDTAEARLTCRRVGACKYKTRAEAVFALEEYLKEVPGTTFKVMRW